MENSIKQKSASYSSLVQERANLEQSLRGEDKEHNWFFRQLKIHDNDNYSNIIDSDFATAVAAATVTIHSKYQINQRAEINKLADTRKQGPSRPQQLTSGGVSRRLSLSENKQTGAAARKPVAQNERAGHTLARRQTIESEADSWEKNEMSKIKSRYEAMYSKILQWENGKKARAKRRMERKKSEMEQKKAANLQHYKARIGRIDNIAVGAKAQAEQNKKIEESRVKERAKKIRSTGKIPAYFFCF